MPSQNRSYVGVGIGDTTNEIKSIVKQITEVLNEANYVLRSDGEQGISSLFIKHAKEKEIYLPYKDYNGYESEYHKSTREAEYIASRFHPCFYELKIDEKKIVSRYSHVVLGHDLRQPASFIICYTEDKVESVKDKAAYTGILGQVIAIGSAMAIPIYNLAKEDCVERLNKRFNANIKL